MRSFDRTFPFHAALLTAALAVANAVPADAEEVMQLIVPQAEYTMGGFKYQPPKVDGWRQISLAPNTLSLVYAEQKEDEKIETRFGVAMESHEIPAGTKVESAAALAELSRTQMSEARKEDVVSVSPVQPVASIENLYSYKMLVHVPIKTDPDAYEVYYVMLAPDRKEYLVIQCITKSQTYENDLYFQQFYGSLSSLKYTPKATAAAPASPDSKATSPDSKATSPDSEPATPPAAH